MEDANRIHADPISVTGMATPNGTLTDGGTDELVTFLRSRFTSAREAEASKVSIPGNLGVNWEHHYQAGEEYVLINGHDRVDAQEFWQTHGRPAADPVVLADLDSKLAILGLCETETPETGGKPLAQRVMRLLAAPYATHPDCKENWRP